MIILNILGGQNVGRVVEGQPAFIIWKSLYFSKLLSTRNQAQVIFDWISTSLFGRDISTVHNIQATNIPKKAEIMAHNMTQNTVQSLSQNKDVVEK